MLTIKPPSSPERDLDLVCRCDPLRSARDTDLTRRSDTLRSVLRDLCEFGRTVDATEDSDAEVADD